LAVAGARYGRISGEEESMQTDVVVERDSNPSFEFFLDLLRRCAQQKKEVERLFEEILLNLNSNYPGSLDRAFDLAEPELGQMPAAALGLLPLEPTSDMQMAGGNTAVSNLGKRGDRRGCRIGDKAAAEAYRNRCCLAQADI
jgi:hypothetical protein